MLCYHLEAKDYVHEGLVEKGVDVEKTQKSEQKVEKGFSTMFPVLWSYYEAQLWMRVTRFLHRWICSQVNPRLLMGIVHHVNLRLLMGLVHQVNPRLSQVEAKKSSLK